MIPSALVTRQQLISCCLVSFLLLSSCLSTPSANVLRCDAAVAPPAATTFQLVDSGLPTRGQWRDGFAVADVNGDGALDVVSGPPRKGVSRPVIFLNDGKAKFDLASTIHFPPLPYDYGDVAVGDLNHDGRPDIALASHIRGLVALIEETPQFYAPWGTGLKYRNPGEFPDERAWSSKALALVDWDGDGSLDIASLSDGPTRLAGPPMLGFTLYLNHRGDWDSASSTDKVVDLSFGSSLTVGDFNGDGHVDAFTSTAVMEFRNLLRLGDGRGWRSVDSGIGVEKAFVTAVATLHGKGKDDVVVGYRTPLDAGGWCLRLSRLTWRRGKLVETVLLNERSDDDIAEIAMTPEGIAVIRQSGSAEVMQLNGSQRQSLPLPRYLEGCNGFDIASADLDADGQAELVASYATDVTIDSLGRCPGAGGFAVWKRASGR